MYLSDLFAITAPRLMGLDLVPRNEDGQSVDEKDVSMVSLYKMVGIVWRVLDCLRLSEIVAVVVSRVDPAVKRYANQWLIAVLDYGLPEISKDILPFSFYKHL